MMWPVRFSNSCSRSKSKCVALSVSHWFAYILVSVQAWYILITWFNTVGTLLHYRWARTVFWSPLGEAAWCFRMTMMWWRQKSWKILNTMLFQSHQLSTSTKMSSPDQHLVHWVAACQHASTPQEPSTSVLYLTVITLRRYYRKNLMWGCVCICAVCVCECGVCVCVRVCK